MTIRKVPHPGWNLEYLMWLFMRISGLAFFLLAITGMIVALIQGARSFMGLGTLMRWTFFPNPFHVQAEVPDVDLGWRSGFWQAIEISILFFGGWLSPIPGLPDGVFWMVVKMVFFFFMFAMVKAIVPRYRYDQLMRLGWKVFLPLSIAAIVIVALVLQLTGWGGVPVTS